MAACLCPPERQAPLGTNRQWQGLLPPKIIKHAVTGFLLYLHKILIQVSTWEKAPASSLFFYRDSDTCTYTNSNTHPLQLSLFTHDVTTRAEEVVFDSVSQRNGTLETTNKIRSSFGCHSSFVIVYFISSCTII